MIQQEIESNGWMVWPPIRYCYRTVNTDLPSPAPSPPAFSLTRAEACAKYPNGVSDPNCVLGNMNWLGTDDQGRDVIARLIYGFRISVLFGLILTIAVLGHRRHGRCRAGLFRRLDRPRLPAVDRDLDVRSRPSIC